MPGFFVCMGKAVIREDKFIRFLPTELKTQDFSWRFSSQIDHEKSLGETDYS